MTQDIERLLGSLDGDLSPIQEAARRHWALNGTIDPGSGAVSLDHRPRFAPEAYALVLYPGLTPGDLARYEQLSIPLLYREILYRLNGAFLFEAALFGVPRSMIQDSPRLDRSILQPLDVGEANRHWRIKYKVDPSLFYFGSGPHSYTEQRGYFLAGDGRIDAYLPGGKRLATWPSLGQFLSAELARLEAIYPESEQRQEQIRKTRT
jgi:hypothetical protein